MRQHKSLSGSRKGRHPLTILPENYRPDRTWMETDDGKATFLAMYLEEGVVAATDAEPQKKWRKLRPQLVAVRVDVDNAAFCLEDGTLRTDGENSSIRRNALARVVRRLRPVMGPPWATVLLGRGAIGVWAYDVGVPEETETDLHRAFPSAEFVDSIPDGQQVATISEAMGNEAAWFPTEIRVESPDDRGSMVEMEERLQEKLKVGKDAVVKLDGSIESAARYLRTHGEAKDGPAYARDLRYNLFSGRTEILATPWTTPRPGEDANPRWEAISDVEVLRWRERLGLARKLIAADRLLDDLRTHQGVEPALGLPPGPNSGLTVCRV